MKKLLFAVLLICFFGCKKDHTSSLELIDYIPKTAAIVVKIPDYSAFSKSIAENDFYGQHPDFNFFKNARNQLEFLSFLNLKNPVLLNFSKEGKDETVFSLIAPEDEHLLTDMALKKVTDSTEYAGYYIKRVNLNNKENYFALVDSVFILSDSKLVTENIIRQKNYPVSEAFKKAYHVLDHNNTSVLINHDYIDELVNNLLPKNNIIPLKNFANWTSLDIEFHEKELKLNGISTTSSTAPQILKIFSNLSAQENEIAKVTPINAEGFYAFGYNDFSVLQQNLKSFHTNLDLKGSENQDLFELTKEIGIMYFQEEKAIVLNTLDIIEAQETITNKRTLVKTFRGNEIYQFENGNLFAETFKPLIKLQNQDYFIIIEHFIVFAEAIKTLEHIIANFQNETTLDNQEFYKDAFANLSSESSILLVSLNQNIIDKVSEMADSGNLFDKINFKQHPVTALQFINDNNFAHVHAIFNKHEAKSTSEKNVTQMASVSLENNLLTKPFLFSNHLNNQKEIVVQDEQHNLYLISNTGKVLWKKNLNEPILGTIQKVDLYKNNKFQLAFTTPTRFYILDRNGNEVKPFPLKFEDRVTQALSVFDYDNSRDYRFVIVQDDKLSMYNSAGKIVKGFKFEETNSAITQAPKHIRIGKKDYILAPDNSGKLHILNRQGNTRVKVEESLNFTDNQWFLYNNNFASTNADGDLLLIDEKGNIKKEQLNLSENHRIIATAQTLVTLSDNVLRIAEKEIELDYGMFSEPQIFQINKKSFIAITDLQSHRVYIYDSSGNLLPNFPVYGNSAIILSNFNNDKNIEFAVQGEENSILLYKIH